MHLHLAHTTKYDVISLFRTYEVRVMRVLRHSARPDAQHAQIRNNKYALAGERISPCLGRTGPKDPDS